MAKLQLAHISKSFPGVKALDDISLSIMAGEIHALCGENGAGKSTLMNILAGNLRPDKGSIAFDGKEVVMRTPQAAFSLGISIVYQHLSLVDNLSVAENIFANQQPCNVWGIIQFNELYQKTTSLLKQLQLDEINPRTLVFKLSPAQKQMIEIAKALAKNPSLFILDEPTASLSEKETKILFLILTDLKRKGVSIIYISHRLEDIFQLADRISVLKDGKYQGTFLKEKLTKDKLIQQMVGREIKALKTNTNRTQEVLLSVQALSGKRFTNITFQLHRGEILGLAGLVGAGRTEIARAIFGIDKFESGKIILRNRIFHANHPSESISQGLAYVPEERKTAGLFPEMTIQDNIISGNLAQALEGNIYRPAKANLLAVESQNKFHIVAPSVLEKVVNLSGGNQQKVVLAKWFLTNPDVLIVDEPTHGIDVGAKFEIYEILQSLAISGKGILLISSDLPELLGICDRILIMKKGKIAGTLDGSLATEEKIMDLASH